MKTFKYFSMIALSLGLGGCEFGEGDRAMNQVRDSGGDAVVSEAGRLAVDLPVAHVEVQEYQSVHLIPQPSYDVDLRVTYADGIERRRTLRLAHSADALGRGFTLNLLDDRDNVLITITQRWGMDTDNTHHYFMHEATAADTLTLNATVSGEHVAESYVYNGNATDFDYTRSTPSENSAIAAFDDFYHHPRVSATRSLDDNREGQMMIGLVTDTAFIAWARRSIRPAHQTDQAKVACDEICNTCSAASACSLVKCPFGGISNPVCVACTGVGVACVITWVARFFIDF